MGYTWQRLRFCYPFGDGIVDEIKYYLDSYITSSPNPNDRSFYRKENAGLPFELNYGVTNLDFNYYDSAGNLLPPTPPDLKKIAVIEYNITLEDIYGYNYTYNIDDTDRKIGDTYYIAKSKTGKVAIKNLKFR